jgi:tetratricopeptide (TPR) repeat protein
MAKVDKELQALTARLEANPDDLDAVRKLAELFQFRKEDAQSAEYYGQLATALAQQGFAIRAVPMFKQALKLDRSRIDLNLALAQQYQEMGLKAEALAQMHLVCEAYQQEGQSEALLELLTHMLLLDPDNVAVRVRRAELCVDLGYQAEGIAELGRAGGYLKRNNRIDEYVKIGERILFLDTNNVPLGRELAQIYLALGETRSALAKLQSCFQVDPQDIETLTLLAQAFLDLGQANQGAKVYKELARVYAEADQSDEEAAAWAKVRSLNPDDPDLPRRAKR